MLVDEPKSKVVDATPTIPVNDESTVIFEALKVIVAKAEGMPMIRAMRTRGARDVMNAKSFLGNMVVFLLYHIINLKDSSGSTSSFIRLPFGSGNSKE